MFRGLLLCILILFGMIFSVAQAQEQRERTISGKILDAEQKEPMELTTIQMFVVADSSFVGGTVTNEHGNFSIEAPSNGSYRLKISMMGYQPIQREVTIRRNQSVDLGTLLMSLTPTMLMLMGEKRKDVLVGAVAVNILTNVPLNYFLLTYGNLMVKA